MILLTLLPIHVALKPIKALTVAFMVGLVAMQAAALPSDHNQPVKLLADKATFNEKTGITEYIGNVKISQGSLKIDADRITVKLNQDNSIRSVLASGNPAHMQQQVSADRGVSKGQANQISYDANTGIINLQGSAKLTQDGASISSETIRYSLSAGDFEANRGQSNQVELIIPPSSQSSHLPIRPR